MLLVGLQATSGLFISDDIFYAGPYNTVVSTSTADWLAGWHHRLFTLIQITVLLHILAVSWYTWGKKEGLIQAMFHGKKMLKRENTEETVSEHRVLRALLLLSIAAALVATLVYVAPVPEYEFY